MALKINSCSVLQDTAWTAIVYPTMAASLLNPFLTMQSGFNDPLLLIQMDTLEWGPVSQ